MEAPKNNIGEIIRRHRELKDLSQEDVGELVGKSPQTIGRYERGETVPRKEEWNLLCKVLEIPVDAYFHESKEAGEYVSDTKNQTYIDKPLKELKELVIKERDFLEKIGFVKFLKIIPEMTNEDKKLYIPTLKNIFKLIKRSNKNGT